MKATALAEQLALLRGQGSDAGAEIAALKKKYSELEAELKDFRSKSDILMQSEKIKQTKLERDIKELEF